MKPFIYLALVLLCGCNEKPHDEFTKDEIERFQIMSGDFGPPISSDSMASRCRLAEKAVERLAHAQYNYDFALNKWGECEDMRKQCIDLSETLFKQLKGKKPTIVFTIDDQWKDFPDSAIRKQP